MGAHHHHHVHEVRSQSDSAILSAFFLNAGFAVIEFIGGHYTNSTAIKSDAIHDLVDSLTLPFSYFAEKMSHKEEDEIFTFGYRRFSVLAALINGLVLLGGTGYVIYEAIGRLYEPEPVVASGMIVFALLGIGVNGLAAFKLKRSGGLNSKMIMLHLLEDILGWVAVLVVSVILMFKPWYFLDSVLSILISLVVIRGVYKNFISIGSILLQKFPAGLEKNRIREKILSYDCVQDVHLVRGWSIDESKFYLTLHVRVSLDTTMGQLDSLRKEIETFLREEDVLYSTIQFEGEECREETH